LDGVALPFRLAGAVQALKIGSYLQESLRTGKKLNFDEIGEPIVEKSGETAKL
jgi:myo-inositol 2-dehydrogenase/D-chiro-inositol 1-dehydrogenase